MPKVTGPCGDSKCELPAVTRAGYCLKHYKRWKRRGTTHDVTPEERFFSYIKPVAEWDACWVWANRLMVGGYGSFNVAGKMWLAHRWSYQFLRAEIPVDLKIDHLCGNPSCVNPWHLEPVTQRVNLHRGRNHVGVNARKTHCLRGHEFDEGNTYLSRNGTHRHCRKCMRIRARS